MVTLAELKREHPEYDKMSALHKILLENEHGTRSAQFRKWAERPLEVILTVGLPVGLYFLAKEGHAVPNPGFGRYALAAVTGLVSGKVLGTAFGTLIYEIVDKEGDVRQFYQKVKRLIPHHSDSGQAI